MSFSVSFYWFCRYWNDPEVLAKLSGAIGFGGMPFDLAADAGANTQEEEEKEEVAGDEDEELNVHHTASVGDVEV